MGRKSTLITGATGFVGSAVLRKLLGHGFEIRAMVRPTSDLRNLNGLPVETVTGDLDNTDAIHKALSGCNSLFHVAADYRLWVPDPVRMYRTNVDGTLNIMKAALEEGVERIVYTSSVATLGLHPDGTPADETTPAQLSDMAGPYKRSKFLAETAVSKMVKEQGLPAVIVNPSTPVGPGDVYCTPTGRTILRAASGKMPAYVDTGLNLVHVDDVATGHYQAFTRGQTGERYILGGQNMTLREILESLSVITGKPIPRIRLPHGLVMPMAFMAEGMARVFKTNEPFLTVSGARLARKKMFFSSEKARENLGYTTRPIAEAFKDAIEWYKENGML